ncbi:MAG TPA: hypothetical protein VGK67_03815 [Myxococcales bacterium]|jgi:hypothetical protein
MLARTIAAVLALLVVSLPALALAETPEEKAKALLAAKDCDQLLLSFENSKPQGDAGDLALAKVLAQAASGPCASDKIVGMALATTAARLAPGDVEVLMAAAGASRAAGMNGEAEATYRKAIAAAPKDPRPRMALAEQLLGEQDAAGAVKVLEPVKADPKSAALYAKAQKAAKDASAEAENLRKGEERAMAAAAKAMASDAKSPSSGGGGKVRGDGTASDGIGGEGGGKVAFVTGGLAAAHGKVKNTRLRAGKWYRVQATGNCTDLRRDQLSGNDHWKTNGSDVRVRIGKFEHGLAIENGGTEDFDFQADSSNPSLEIWDGSFTKGEIHCVVSLTIFEK